MRNITHKWPQSGRFFSKLGHFFPIFGKLQGRPLPLPHLDTCLLYERTTSKQLIAFSVIAKVKKISEV